MRQFVNKRKMDQLLMNTAVSSYERWMKMWVISVLHEYKFRSLENKQLNVTAQKCMKYLRTKQILDSWWAFNKRTLRLREVGLQVHIKYLSSLWLDMFKKWLRLSIDSWADNFLSQWAIAHHQINLKRKALANMLVGTHNMKLQRELVEKAEIHYATWLVLWVMDSLLWNITYSRAECAIHRSQQRKWLNLMISAS